MNDRRARITIVVAIAAGVAVTIVRLPRLVPGYAELYDWLFANVHPLAAAALPSALLVLASLIVARIAAGRGNTLAALGLRAPLLPGVLLGVLIGLPMLLQAPFSSNGTRFEIGLAHGIVTAPVNEEIFFRGMLVLVPVYVGGNRFWPFAIGAGLLFGAMHVPWDERLSTGHIGTFVATTAGGIWYAWLLRCFDRNLWLTISLHATMNAAWAVFRVSEDAAGGVWPNLGRAGTIALGTVLAVRRLRRAGAKAGG
ncbi:MAG: CPBP family intramembrane metalloprotease [Planctomycetes bacterium]|nr:CPBP family intramembrane metalloprotease [Planctomycetota bacterium]